MGNEKLFTFEIVREVNCHPDRFTRPYQHGIFPAQVGNKAALAIGCQTFYLFWAILPLDHLELEAVQVHGMGHALAFVLEFPDFGTAFAYRDRIFIHLEGFAVDEPLHHIAATPTLHHGLG